MNGNHPDANNDRLDTLQHTFDATATEADQAALDRLMRHTRHAAAKPARRGLGFNWGWVAAPLMAAGAVAAVTLATPTNTTITPDNGGPVAVTADPASIEDELALAIAEAEVLGEAADDTAGEVLAGLDADLRPDTEEWLPEGSDELDEAELDAWIAAYEAVLSEG